MNSAKNCLDLTASGSFTLSSHIHSLCHIDKRLKIGKSTCGLELSFDSQPRRSNIFKYLVNLLNYFRTPKTQRLPVYGLTDAPLPKTQRRVNKSVQTRVRERNVDNLNCGRVGIY